MITIPEKGANWQLFHIFFRLDPQRNVYDLKWSIYLDLTEKGSYFRRKKTAWFYMPASSRYGVSNIAIFWKKIFFWFFLGVLAVTPKQRLESRQFFVLSKFSDVPTTWMFNFEATITVFWVVGRQKWVTKVANWQLFTFSWFLLFWVEAGVMAYCLVSILVSPI